MLNRRPGEAFAADSDPVKQRTAAAGRPAGTPFRIPALADPAAPGSPANAFRPHGNALPPGDAPDGNLRNPLLSDARNPAAISTRQMLEQASARLNGEASGTAPDASGLGRIAGTEMAGEPAAAGVDATIESGDAPLPANLLPDLELEFPAAPLETRSGGLSLLVPPLDGSATRVDAFSLFGGGIAPGSAGTPYGPINPTLSDPLSAVPPGIRLPEWGGALAGGSAGSAPPGLQGVAVLPGLPGAVTAGDSAADGRVGAENPFAGLAALNGQPAGPPVPPVATAANGWAGQPSVPGLQASPPGLEAVAGLRQAMADLAGDRGGSAGDRSRPAPEVPSRTDGAGFLSTLGLTTASQASGADRPVFTLPSLPGTPEFASQVAERVVWMAGQKLDRAQIRLNPAHLGPISVDVSVGEDGANITFTAQHALTRDALEQALPRLREMFNGSGLALAGADVSGQGPDTQRGGDEAGAAAGGDPIPGAGVSGAGDAEAVAGTPVRSGAGRRGLIDTYV